VGGRLRRAFVAAAAAAIAALVLAPGALAHAILVSSQPASDAVLGQSPGEVVLRFNEPVETAFGSLRVLDAHGARVDRGRIARPAGDSVAVPIDHVLATGTYTVAWRVVSADTHPVHGAFVFSVGAAARDAKAIAARVLREQQTPKALSVAFTVVRFSAFALILLAAGGVVSLVLVLGSATSMTMSRLWTTVAAASATLTLASLAGIVLQGASAGGLSVGAAAHSAVVSEVVSTRFGQVWLARAGVALTLTALAVVLARTHRAGPARWTALCLAVLLTLSPAAAGHASTGGVVAWVADVAHVAAAAVWTGGLAFVLVALALERERRWQLAATAVARFSTVAVIAVGVLLAAGIANGYLQVREWRGLWETSYGRLLLAKAALLLPVLGLGLYNNRRSLPRLRTGQPTAQERRLFLKATGAELGLVTAIVAVTAVLVAEPPARSQLVPSGPFATTAALGDLELNVVVDPARSGANTIHMYLLTPSGRPAQVADANVSAFLPSNQIGPFRYATLRAGPGHFIVPHLTLPYRGDWQLQVAVRRGKFEELDQTVKVPVH
jgi:copper transport protein